MNTAVAAPTKNELMELITNTSIKPSQVIKSAAATNRFVATYAKVHGIRNMAKAQAFCEAEQHHFLKIINDNPNIAKCTKLSLYGIFMDVAVLGLSFDPTMKHLYIVPFNTNVGTKQAPKYESRAALQISGQGELLLRVMQGQIKYADNPVIVFEGDEFRYGSKDGKVVLDHVACYPRKSTKMLACYVKIVRHDDSVDYKVMAMEDIEQLRKFSKDPNSLAWTTGMAGMVQAKTIKHAFKSYPKLRVGDFSKLESEVVEAEPETAIDYGFGTNYAAEIEQHDLLANSLPPITESEEVKENIPPAVATPAATPATPSGTNTITVEDDTF